MKQRLWNACKFLIPLIALLYVEEWLRKSLELFWFQQVLRHISFFSESAYSGWFQFGASAALTLLGLLAIGFLLEFSIVRRLFDAITRRIPLLGYLWSGEEHAALSHTIAPVLFQHPMPGEWKIGFNMGEQRMDNGKILYRIFFFTGIGDHQLIEKERTDLMVPLDNSSAEMMKLIASFMTSGPRVLKKREPPRTTL